MPWARIETQKQVAAYPSDFMKTRALTVNDGLFEEFYLIDLTLVIDMHAEVHKKRKNGWSE
jgi:hypothetical protein